MIRVLVTDTTDPMKPRNEVVEMHQVPHVGDFFAWDVDYAARPVRSVTWVPSHSSFQATIRIW